MGRLIGRRHHTMCLVMVKGSVYCSTVRPMCLRDFRSGSGDAAAPMADDSLHWWNVNPHPSQAVPNDVLRQHACWTDVLIWGRDFPPASPQESPTVQDIPADQMENVWNGVVWFILCVFNTVSRASWCFYVLFLRQFHTSRDVARSTAAVCYVDATRGQVVTAIKNGLFDAFQRNLNILTTLDDRLLFWPTDIVSVMSY